MSRGFMFLAAFALVATALPGSTSAQVTPQGEVRVSVKSLGETLGLKPSNSGGADALELGATVTFTLTDPAKLAKHTIRGLHEGARVTATRVAPDRIRVEADEMEPVPVSRKVTLRVNTDGTLTPVPDGRGKTP